jgi:hypothetical protein
LAPACLINRRIRLDLAPDAGRLVSVFFESMEKTMPDPFARWTGYIVLTGLFLVFLAHFGKFVWTEIWPVLRPVVAFVKQLIK